MAGQRKHHEGAQPGKAARRWSWIFVAAASVLVAAMPQASAQFANVGRGPSVNMNTGPRISIHPPVRYSPGPAAGIRWSASQARVETQAIGGG